MKKIVLVVCLISLLGSGCGAEYFACTTEASLTPNGPLTYKSCKNQQNFHALVKLDEAGKVKELDVSTTAATPEAAIAAAMQSMAKLIDTLDSLVKSAIAVGTKGAVALPATKGP